MGQLPEFAEIDRLLLGVLKQAGFYPKVVYDIGASQGYWSALVSDQVFPNASYHLFEPLAESPRYVDHLRRVVAGHPLFIVHNVALGAGEGSAEFWTDAEQYGSTALDMKGVPGFTVRNVTMQRLDNYVDSQKLALPDLIKLDVQGLELEILEHASNCLENATALYVETWLMRGYGDRTPLLHDIQQHLDRFGFDLVELGDRYYSEGHLLAAIDALFVRRSWARSSSRTLLPGDWASRRD